MNHTQRIAYLNAQEADDNFVVALIKAYGPEHAADARYMLNHTDPTVIIAKQHKLDMDQILHEVSRGHTPMTPRDPVESWLLILNQPPLPTDGVNHE